MSAIMGNREVFVAKTSGGHRSDVSHVCGRLKSETY